MKHLLMGSVAEDLFRHLPCPVLTVGPNVSKASMRATDIKHILFPTDLSHESQKVFPYLASLASEYKASLTLLRRKIETVRRDFADVMGPTHAAPLSPAPSPS
jgi:nucleotide-binding universal stress UspA family protein